MAIQVNGTTVIDNSRNLTNISSIDSTTATAIGNAGVGGTLVDLGFTSLTSTNFATLDISMPSGYHKVYIEIYNLFGANTSNLSSPEATFKDSGGTVQNNSREYWYERSNNATQDTKIVLGTIPLYNVTNQYGEVGFWNLHVEISNYASSTQPTLFDIFTSGSHNYANGSAYQSTQAARGSTRRSFTVSALRLTNYWNFRAGSNCGYQMYGWKA